MNRRVGLLKFLTIAFALGALLSAGATQARAKERNVNSSSRPSAIHDCNIAADKYSPITQLPNQFAVYGTCMTEHGQRFG